MDAKQGERVIEQSNLLIDLCKKHLGKVMYDCELNKLECDLVKECNLEELEAFSEKDQTKSNEAFCSQKSPSLIVLVFKHIYNSTKSAAVKGKENDGEFYKIFSRFVYETVVEKKKFHLSDFFEAVARFLCAELKIQDDAFETCKKPVNESLCIVLKGKLVLSCQVGAILKGILMSNEMTHIPASEINDLRIGLINMIKQLASISKFQEHKDYQEISVFDKEHMRLFSGIASNCLKSINLVMSWLSQIAHNEGIHPSFNKSVLKNTMAGLSLIVFQNIGRNSWTSMESRVEAQNMLSFLCKLTNCENVQILLSGVENMPKDEITNSKNTIFYHGIAGLVLENVKSKFVKNGWKRDPSLVHIILYVTTNMKYPSLHPHIKLLVPMLLEVIEDYNSENQVLGIECLRYLIKNVNPSDLNLYNHGELIYHVLFKLLYGTKLATLEVLLPCLLEVLYVLEAFPERLDIKRTSKWDETILKLITNLEYENNVDLREVMVMNLSGFLKANGINNARHLLPILRTVSSCLEMYDNKDGRIRRHGLDVLKVLVIACWPLMLRYISIVMKIIIKLVIDVSVAGSLVVDDTKIIIKQKSKEIFLLLSECCGSDLVAAYVNNAVDAEIGVCFHEVKVFLKDVVRDVESNGY